MTDKRWRKKIAVMLAASMLVMHAPAAMAEAADNTAAAATEGTAGQETSGEDSDESKSGEGKEAKEESQEDAAASETVSTKAETEKTEEKAEEPVKTEEKTAETPAAAEPAKTEEKAAEAPAAPEPAKTEEKAAEAPAAAEPAKTEEKAAEAPAAPEPAKTEEKAAEAPAAPEPAKTEEKAAEAPAAPEPVKTEEKAGEAPAKAEVKAAQEKADLEKSALGADAASDPTGSSAAADTQTDGTAGTQTDASAGTQTDGTAGTQTDAAAGAQTDGAAGTQTDTAAGTQTDGAADTQTDGAAGTQTDTAAGTQTDAAAGTQTDAAAGTQTDTAADTQTDGAAGTQTDAAAGTQTDTAADTQTDTKTDSQTDTSDAGQEKSTEDTAGETETEAPAAESAESGSQNAGGDQNNASAADQDSSKSLITTASVSVTWKDDNDANDIRPGFMAVYLQKSTDGNTYDEGVRYELNEENGWAVRLENLPLTEDGQNVTYRWVWEIDQTPEGSINPVESEDEQDEAEHNLVGYTRTQNEASADLLESRREYTHETIRETYRISINWDNNGDTDAKIPDSLDVTLPDGNVVTLTKENNWTLDVELPIMHRDLIWTIAGADGWVSDGNSTEYNEDNTAVTFRRKWETEEVEEEKTVKKKVKEKLGYSDLTVQYWIGTEQAAPSFVGRYENGQTYNVAVSSVTGYRAQVTRVKGKISEDTVINVNYVPNSYTVTVYYRYLNGQAAAADSSQKFKTGSSYEIKTPQVAGYVPSQTQITGTVTGRNLTYVVYYTAIPVPAGGSGEQGSNNNGDGRQDEQMIETEQVEEIDENRTALGLGEVGINAGECFE